MTLFNESVNTLLCVQEIGLCTAGSHRIPAEHVAKAGQALVSFLVISLTTRNYSLAIARLRVIRALKAPCGLLLNNRKVENRIQTLDVRTDGTLPITAVDGQTVVISTKNALPFEFIGNKSRIAFSDLTV